MIWCSASLWQGMGEPLHNFGAVSAALQILCHGQGLQFSPNKVTVSTVGLIPEMRALAATSSVQLAVSLHATTDEIRSWIAPVNRRSDAQDPPSVVATKARF